MASPTGRPTGMFLGYMARKPWKPKGDWDPTGLTRVIEVCSASDCMCERPAGWVERWDFNRAAAHDSPEAALAAVPESVRGDFSVFAYWLLPDSAAPEGEPRQADFDERLPSLPTSPGPDSFDELGFDVVGLAMLLPPFGHSPLSCNGLALSERVNRWCLIDELERAQELPARWSTPTGGWEPGTYRVVRVAREPSGLRP